MKKILISILTATLLFSTTPVTLYANQNDSIQTRAETKEWKYKIINGKLYKRLWNKTKRKWETKWIPV